MLAAYLLDPAESRYLLADLLLRYAGLELPIGAGGASPARAPVAAASIRPAPSKAANSDFIIFS